MIGSRLKFLLFVSNPCPRAERANILSMGLRIFQPLASLGMTGRVNWDSTMKQAATRNSNCAPYIASNEQAIALPHALLRQGNTPFEEACGHV